MCDPVTIGLSTAALAVGQAGLEYKGQNDASKANETAANLNYAQKRELVMAQGVQMDQERSEKTLDTAISSLQAQGAIAASASDMGLAPTSIIQALNASAFGTGRQVAADATNFRNQRDQLGRDLTGAEITRQSTIASKPRASKLGLALGVGGGLLKGGTSYASAGGR